MHGPRRELQGIPGSPPDLQNLPSGCPFRTRCAHAMPECAEIHPELEPTAFGEERRTVACLLHTPGHTVPPELAEQTTGR
ncbi:oligopeptide/dipeptide ABC transporter ATP-binding protein [Luteimicrobium album]|uniref:oligopeptide/dipeptide ABC transporter ATP-binding protein n=1 Tax=Luteimicrobium album TaxID=1054550 RepID=UPI0024E154CC|nr:oligopeptide/dipeptide ABC transporter ATP-binding protein [Luteimicrobium album]